MRAIRVAIISIVFALSAFVQPAGADQQSPGGGLIGEQTVREQYEQQYLDAHRDRQGRLRPDLWRAAMAQTKRMSVGAWRDTNKKPHAVRTAHAVLSSPVTGTQWTQVGPAPLRIDAEQNFQGSGPDAGQVTDIAIDPRNSTDSTIYAAFNNGGIWKSTDGGSSWTPKTDLMVSLSMGAVALDPTNPSIVYAGTGNRFNNGFSNGIGIYKSIDGGDSWSTVGASVLAGKNIQRIVVLPGNIVLAASDGGLYRSADGGANWGNNSPGFNNNLPVEGGYITDLKADTTTSNTVYAAVNGSGLFQSTDGGATFGATPIFGASNLSGVTGGMSYLSFAQSTQPDNQTLYVNVRTPSSNDCTKDSSGKLTSTAICAQLYKSTDGGGTWSLMSGGNDLTTRARENGGCQCGYDQTIGVDPQNASRVYAGFQELYLSTDGGATFGTPAVSRNKIHWDHHAITFSPQNHWGASTTTRVWVGEDGGLAASTDAGSTWSNLNEGIATNLFRGIDIGRGSTTNNQYTYGGTQDTGTIERRPGFSGNDWHLGIDGDGGPVAVDPCNASTTIGNDDGGFIRTTDGGSTWGGGSGFPTKATVGAVAFDPNCGTAYAATYTNPSPGTTNVYLFRSTDSGANWSQMTQFAANNGITTISTDKLDSNVLWLGFNDGSVQQTSNAGSGSSATWTAVSVTGAPGAPVGGIALDPTNTAIAVVAYTGFCGCGGPSTLHAFRTTDNGGSWTDISGSNPDTTQDLPDIPLNSVVIDAFTTPHTIIVSSDAAVMRTADNGATWQVLGSGLPPADITSLQLDSSSSPAVLRAGTYGRSVFELTVANAPHLSVNGNLAFGTVAVGDNKTSILQLFNTGANDLNITSIGRVSGSSDFTISGPITPVVIPAGEELDYTVKFAPTSPGPLTASFQINSNDPSQPTLQLQATGSGGVPKIALGGDLVFGVVARGQTATKVITVTDTGDAPLQITSVGFDAGSSSEFSVLNPPTLPQTIPVGGSLSVSVQFAPSTSDTGVPLSGVLRVKGVDALAPANASATPADATMSASGTPGVPQAVLTSGPIAFGSIPVDERTTPHTSTQILRISNQASCPLCDLHVSAITISGTNASDFSVVAPSGGLTFPLTIGAGNHVDITLSFDPSDVGTRMATVTVASDDPANASQAVSLTGTGLLPGLTAAPAPLIFPPTVYDPQCTPSCGTTLNETVTNSGQAELILDQLLVTGQPASNPFTAAAPTNPLTRVLPTNTFAEAVTFHPTSAIGSARAVRGTLHMQDLFPDPADHVSTPVQANVPVCGESVGRGIRVLVKDTSGNVVSSLSKLSLQSHGLTNPVNIQLRNVALKTVTAPTACQTFQYHYENQALQPAGVATNRGSYYNISVSVGSKQANASFTLDVNEFKQMTLVVQ